jgi:hypothetical protein
VCYLHAANRRFIPGTEKIGLFSANHSIVRTDLQHLSPVINSPHLNVHRHTTQTGMMTYSDLSALFASYPGRSLVSATMTNHDIS